jgi:hypothetical protein
MANTNVTINGIATLASGFAQRQVLAKYVDAYRDEMGYFDWMDMMSGGEEITGVPVFDHLEEDTVQSIATTVGTTTLGTGNANKTIVFLGTAAVPRVRETILFPNGVTGFVWSIAANSTNWDVVVKPIGSTNIPATTDAMSLIILSNAGGEGGSNALDVRQPTLLKRQNNIQIFESGDSITDIGGATKVEIEYNGQYYMLDKVMARQLLIHRMQVANQKIFGVKDSFAAADGKMTYFTEGIRTTANSTGFTGQTASSGTFDIIVDGRALAVLMDAARCGTEYMALAGQTAHLAIDVNAATNAAFSGGGISYAAYNGSKDISLAFGAKSIRFGGYTLHIQRFKPLEHKGLTGAVGYEAFKKEILLLPTDKAMIKGGASVPRIRNRYMAFDGKKSLKYMEVETGALSPNKTNNTREYRRDIYSQEGVEIIDPKKLGVFKIQA